MIFLLLPAAAALGFAVLVFVVATHKPFVPPWLRRRRMMLLLIPGVAFLLGTMLFKGRSSRDTGAGGTDAS